MAPAGPRYLLVMRHAERQDEVEDDWAGLEAGRPGGRPWDPPLSCRGLEQADEAASRLASWEQHTGTRIVAVVTSPFLRCLQTSAAVCRRLDIEQLHISWLVSEALCRITGAPAGPLPQWMWPRPPVPAGSPSDNSARASSCTHGQSTEGFSSAQEFLAQLGAVVAPEACSSGTPGPGREAAQRWVDTATRPPGGEATRAPASDARTSSDAAAGAQSQPHSGRVLEGLFVSVLPPTRGDAPHSSAVGVPAPAPGVDATSTSSAADAVATAQQPPGSALDTEYRHEKEPGAETKAEELQAPGCRPSHHLMEVDAHDVAPSSGDGDVQAKPASSRQQAEGDVLASPNQSSSRSVASGPRAAVAAEGQTAPCVPYSPETLEGAHVRYQAALRCLMAAAAATECSDPTRGFGDGQDSAAAAGGPSSNLARRAVGQQGLGPWRALWRAEVPVWRAEEGSSRHIDGGTEAAGGGGCDVCELRSGAAAKGGAPPLCGGLMMPGSSESAAAGAGSHTNVCGRIAFGSACCSQDGSLDEEKNKDKDEQDAAPQVGPPVASMRQSQPPQEHQQGACAGEAVLVVTHGEAVACAANMVAPWALVFEVRHTGFLVLASGQRNVEDGEEHDAKMKDQEEVIGKVKDDENFAEDEGEAQGDGDLDGGCASGETVWRLVPDPGGERGVLWMSAFEDYE